MLLRLYPACVHRPSPRNIGHQHVRGLQHACRIVGCIHICEENFSFAPLKSDNIIIITLFAREKSGHNNPSHVLLNKKKERMCKHKVWTSGFFCIEKKKSPALDFSLYFFCSSLDFSLYFFALDFAKDSFKIFSILLFKL